MLPAAGDLSTFLWLPQIALVPLPNSNEYMSTALFQGSLLSHWFICPLPQSPVLITGTFYKSWSQVLKTLQLLLFKIALDILGPLYSHVNFRISLSICTKKFFWQF